MSWLRNKLSRTVGRYICYISTLYYEELVLELIYPVTPAWPLLVCAEYLSWWRALVLPDPNLW